MTQITVPLNIIRVLTVPELSEILDSFIQEQDMAIEYNLDPVSMVFQRIDTRQIPADSASNIIKQAMFNAMDSNPASTIETVEADWIDGGELQVTVTGSTFVEVDMTAALTSPASLALTDTVPAPEGDEIVEEATVDETIPVSIEDATDELVADGSVGEGFEAEEVTTLDSLVDEEAVLASILEENKVAEPSEEIEPVVEAPVETLVDDPAAEAMADATAGLDAVGEPAHVSPELEPTGDIVDFSEHENEEAVAEDVAVDDTSTLPTDADIAVEVDGTVDDTVATDIRSTEM